jgi:hypothetical protein
LRLGGQPCPNCGFLPQRPAQYVAHLDGELGLVTAGKARVRYDEFDKAEWHGMLTAVASERGYKPGWVAHKYREKFGDWPKRSGVTPIKPTPEVLSWVRSRNIAFAKRQEASV